MPLRPVDLEQFWKDDALAHEDNCFSPRAPQAALGIRMSEECVFAELNVAGNPWGEHPFSQRREWNLRYNDRAEKIVGRRLLPETFPPEDAVFPRVKRIGEVFGGRYEWVHGTEWLSGDLSDWKALERKLDEVARMDIRAFLLPSNWEAEKRRIYETHGLRPEPRHSIRGPVTLACSLCGAENLIFLLMDAPELAARFSRAIADVAIQMAEVMDAEAGTPERRGYGFADDNCCLLSPELYAAFGLPVLRRVFERFSPDIGDERFQHSDSDMGHLLPLLGTVRLTGVNFGPNVMVEDIRAHLPRARIDGVIAPFTFMHNDEEKLIAQVRRDCEAARRTGRGLNVATAGSINNGSSLESMRAVMWAIQTYGRY